MPKNIMKSISEGIEMSKKASNYQIIFMYKMYHGNEIFR